MRGERRAVAVPIGQYRVHEWLPPPAVRGEGFVGTAIRDEGFQGPVDKPRPGNRRSDVEVTGGVRPAAQTAYNDVVDVRSPEQTRQRSAAGRIGQWFLSSGFE